MLDVFGEPRKRGRPTLWPSLDVSCRAAAFARDVDEWREHFARDHVAAWRRFEHLRGLAAAEQRRQRRALELRAPVPHERITPGARRDRVARPHRPDGREEARPYRLALFVVASLYSASVRTDEPITPTAVEHIVKAGRRRQRTASPPVPIEQPLRPRRAR